MLAWTGRSRRWRYINIPNTRPSTLTARPIIRTCGPCRPRTVTVLRSGNRRSASPWAKAGADPRRVNNNKEPMRFARLAFADGEVKFIPGNPPVGGQRSLGTRMRPRQRASDYHWATLTHWTELPQPSRELGKHFKNQALKVKCLGHREENGVVGGLRAALENAQGLTRIQSGFGEDFEKHRLAHMVAAGAGHQYSARLQHTQRAYVDVLIAARGVIDLLAGLRESRGIEDDHRIAGVSSRKVVEDVGLAEFDVVYAICRSICAGGFDG